MQILDQDQNLELSKGSDTCMNKSRYVMRCSPSIDKLNDLLPIVRNSLLQKRDLAVFLLRSNVLKIVHY